MTKNLKLSFLLTAIFSAIIIAWRTLQTFFSGVGINMVALLAIIAFLVTVCLADKFVFNRIKDLLIIAGIFTVLEIIVYFGLEFIIDGYTHVAGFLIYQNVISILAIFYFAYIAFRFITEFNGIKIGFIEFILGNRHIRKEPKKQIELVNGTLEEKPNNKTSESKENPETKDEE